MAEGCTNISRYVSNASFMATSSSRSFLDGTAPSASGGSYAFVHGDRHESLSLLYSEHRYSRPFSGSLATRRGWSTSSKRSLARSGMSWQRMSTLRWTFVGGRRRRRSSAAVYVSMAVGCRMVERLREGDRLNGEGCARDRPSDGLTQAQISFRDSRMSCESRQQVSESTDRQWSCAFSVHIQQ